MTRAIDRVVVYMAIGAGLVVAALVALTFADVILRYFFSAPLRGRQDLVEMGMVVAVLLAAPFTWRINGHIDVDLFKALPWRVAEKVRLIGIRLLAAAIFGVIGWMAWRGAEDAALFNEATNMILIPHRPFMLFIAAICVLHTALLLIECVALGRSNTSGGAATDSVATGPKDGPS